MTTAGLSRRQVLTIAGLTLGVAAVEFAAPSAALAEPTDPPAGGLTLEPIADQPVAVLSGNGAAPAACPRQLAVKVVNEMALPAGTALSVSYDPRLFAPVASPVVTLGSSLVATTSSIGPSEAVGLHTCVVTLQQEVPARSLAAGDLVVVVGTAKPKLYPYDLVRQPSDAVADLAATGRSPRAHRSLAAQRPPGFAGPATPWGTELTGGWGRQTWGADDQYWYYHPTLVSLRGVGPGRAPAGASFSVTVDPRLVGKIAVAWARLNRKPYRGAVRLAGSTKTDAVYQTRWRTGAVLGPGDVLDVGLRVTTRSPHGALETIKHPLVVSTMGTDPARRSTKAISFTRADSRWR